MFKHSGAASAATAAFVAVTILQTTPVNSQTPASPGPIDLVVTPARQPLALQRSGSAVTVLRSDDFERSGVNSVADLLRGQPGLDVTEAGGRGQGATVRLRGGEARHTLVLIDGIRVNDPSGPAGEFDFANLALANVERIEILRGPQSALYGSDAIGGVINIITRRGRGPARGSVTLEGGSYGTFSTRAAISGGTDTLSYAFGLMAARSDGFSAYGYRIPRLSGFAPFDKDGFDRISGNARLTWRVADQVELEAGFYAGRLNAGYDAAFAGFGFLPDTASRTRAELIQGYLRAIVDPVGSMIRHQVTLLANQTERIVKDEQRYDFGFGLTTEQNRFEYRGRRYGAEYQGTARLGAFGSLVFGGGFEGEALESSNRPGLNSFEPAARASYRRAGWNLFALHQFQLGERIDISLGARADNIEGVRTFITGRATAAYRITETGTKLRASVGTGAKAPSLYQQFSIYSPTRNGDPALKPEESFGFDAGIDQELLNGRMTLSATVFHNRIRDLIDFDFTRGVRGAFGPLGQYVNIARARTQGVELSADVALLEDILRVRASYTLQTAIDETTRLALPRRPAHQGRLSLAWTPLPRLTIEPTLWFVGERFSSRAERDRLAPYARFDARMSYQVTDRLTLYLRAENITNVRYEEVRNYGTTGRAFYAGLTATW